MIFRWCLAQTHRASRTLKLVICGVNVFACLEIRRAEKCQIRLSDWLLLFFTVYCEQRASVSLKNPKVVDFMLEITQTSLTLQVLSRASLSVQQWPLNPRTIA